MASLLDNKGFRRLWISQIALAVGDAIMQMGLLEYFRAHGYNERTETAKLFFAVALPGMLLGPLAIAYVDRWQRRHVLIASDASRAVIVAVIAVWLLPVVLGHVAFRNLFAVYALILIIGSITTFYYPARYALIPNLVGNDKLIPANTLFTTSLAIAGVSGRAIGGFVAERFGVEWAILTNAVAYVIATILVWRIEMDPHATTGGADARESGGWADLKTGLVYIWQHHNALSLSLLSAVFAFLAGAVAVEIVGYTMETLGLRTGGLGYVLVSAGAGAALGIAMVGRAKPWTKASWLPFVQLLLVGGVLILLGLTARVWITVLLLFALGAIAATILIPIDAKLQEEVDDVRRGAVFAARGMLTSGTMIVAFWLQFGSPWFRRTPAPQIMLWLGFGSIAAAVLALATLRGAKRAPARPV
ncbi:MAG TPA: MFS transporter [Verrucomicrobiae bacterium]|nr:MFS transporter [Verrucomicrobiae bacterium]